MRHHRPIDWDIIAYVVGLVLVGLAVLYFS